MRLTFSKYEGLGNDFVVVDAKAGDSPLSEAQAVAICDRHRGIGADGVLIVGHDRVTSPSDREVRASAPSDREVRASAPSMQVINADGSRPEMCGNGIRCVALHLVRTGAVTQTAFDVATDAGPHRCVVSALDASARELQVEVTMRTPSLVPASVPVIADAGDARVLDQAFDAGNRSVRLTCVSMGNPHGVTFDDIGEARRTLGPLLEKHARFPRAANIGFARVLGPQSIELAVWERGVGFTEACGTGACACAVAAVETGRAERAKPIDVRLPGGSLQIVVGAPGERLRMTGPARHVFDGVLEL